MEGRRRRWLGWVLVAAVLGLIAYHFSRHGGWREFHWDRLWSLLVHANPGWLAGAVAASYASYLVRAYRWKYFLDPIKRASLWALFVAQILGFSSIYLIGRPGEIVRPAYIAKREHVPFTSQVAIWLLERAYDGVATVILLALALYFQPVRPGAAGTLRKMHEGASAALIIAGLTVAALAILRLYSGALAKLMSPLLPVLPARFRSHLRNVASSFLEGLDVIQNWQDLLATVVSTAVLWIINVSTFWLVFKSLGGALARLSWWAAGLALFFAALGLVLQLPGVGGGYQVGSILVLRQIFHIPAEAAAGGGILAWIVVLVPCLALGVILLLYEGLTLRTLGKIAQEERAAVTEGA